MKGKGLVGSIVVPAPGVSCSWPRNASSEQIAFIRATWRDRGRLMLTITDLEGRLLDVPADEIRVR